MRLGKELGRGVVTLACAAALCGGRLAAAQVDPTAAPPPPPGRPQPVDAFTDPTAPEADPSGGYEGPRAEGRRNMLWDRVAQERFDADRRRLEADMRRLEAERQRLEAELRRAKEAMRRGEREAARGEREASRGQREASRGQRRGRGNRPDMPPSAAPAPMPMPTPGMPGMPMAPGFPGGPAPMNARPYGPPQGRPQPGGSDWENELMRAHGFDSARRAGGSATFLGVSVTPLPDSLRGRLRLPAGIGMVVSSVEPGSPAQQAGVQPRDVLHKIDEQLLVNAEQLAVLVHTLRAGREVRLSLVRGGKPMQVTVRLGQRNLPPGANPTFDPSPGRGLAPGPRKQARQPMPPMPPMPGMPGLPPRGGMHPPQGVPAVPAPGRFDPGAGPWHGPAGAPQYAPVPVRPPPPPGAVAPVSAEPPAGPLVPSVAQGPAPALAEAAPAASAVPALAPVRP